MRGRLNDVLFVASNCGAGFLHPHRQTRAKKTTVCMLSDRRSDSNEREGPTVKFLLAATGALARLQRDSAELAQAGLTSALHALGVGDEAGDEVDVPTQPRFDPVTAQVLAGYAFRAYEEPSPACYREVRETSVQGSALSGQQRQVVVAHYAFPNADVIASTAHGLFQIAIRQEEEGKENGIGEMYIVVMVNAGVRLNVMQERRFSIIRRRRDVDEDVGDKELRDELALYAYESEAAYQEGKPPLLFGSIDLADVVEQANVKKMPVESGALIVAMNVVSSDQANRDFFGISLLPENVRIPFQRIERLADSLMNPSTIEEAVIVAEITYIPFDMAPPENSIDEEFHEEEGDDLKNMNDGEPREGIYDEGSALQQALREKLPPGQLPLPSNWATLAKGVRELCEETESQRRPAVRENIPQSLFVESRSTDTEAWLFHAKDTKDVVISFRGSEQVSWQDFYTDAQIFLQKWEPGGEIDLNIRADVTVGLATLLSLASSVVSVEEPAFEESKVDEEESCVHYGFLRAYHSVRDAVLHAIDMLVGVKRSDYRFHFVGHSLGGALATLCASDFAAKNRELAENVTCISYGAPKAGNVGFAKLYNSLVCDSFRIVNDADLVVRMPKSIGNRVCERYRHVGRTILVNESGEIWIEGEDPEAGQAIDPFRDRYTDINRLVEYEQEMWNQLVSGRSVRHHMEDSYFLALTEVLRKSTE